MRIVSIDKERRPHTRRTHQKGSTHVIVLQLLWAQHQRARRAGARHAWQHRDRRPYARRVSRGAYRGRSERAPRLGPRHRRAAPAQQERTHLRLLPLRRAPGHAGAARRGRRAPVHAAHRRGHLPHRRLRRARAAGARHRGGRGLHRPRDGREPPRARARGDRGAARRPRPADFRCRHGGPAPQPPARARRRAPAQRQRHRLRRARQRGRHLARGRSRHRVRHGHCRAPATAARASSL